MTESKTAEAGVSEPLPCPFCEGAAKKFYRPDTTGWSNCYWVCCVNEDCGCQTCLHETEDEAIAAWNRRSATAGEPVGEWVLVPREPTEKMLVAACPYFVSPWVDASQRAWSAMLAAAPPAPVAPADVSGERVARQQLDRRTGEALAREIEDLGAFKIDVDGYRVEQAEPDLIDPKAAADLVRSRLEPFYMPTPIATPASSEADGFTAEDFAAALSPLLSGHEAIISAGLSNNFNVIIAALRRASLTPQPSGVSEGEVEALLNAAKAVIAQWDTPNWKLYEPTAAVINRLRRAIDALLASKARPLSAADSRESPAPPLPAGPEQGEREPIAWVSSEGLRRLTEWFNGADAVGVEGSVNEQLGRTIPLYLGRRTK